MYWTGVPQIPPNGPSGALRGHSMRARHIVGLASCLLLSVALGQRAELPTGSAAGTKVSTLEDAQRIVTASTKRSTVWTGPAAGPAAQAGKTIAFLAQEMSNGGVSGVAQGVREAAKIMGWVVLIFDAAGTDAERTKAYEKAVQSKPDGVIFCADDAVANRDLLSLFAKAGVPIVGWHAGTKPGPIAGTPVAMNVSTDPQEVARVTAMAAIAQSRGKAGVVIFSDSKYPIAMAKANAMADLIRSCKGCTLLELRDVPFSNMGEQMPGATSDLLAKYGSRWTHALAINDRYFDYAVPVLTGAQMASNGLSMLSAGDGSTSAFLRIQARTFQTATVAEPLNLHGWQLVDELNRLFAGQPVSGYIAPVHLITSENIADDGGSRLQYDPDNGYRDNYRRIWKR